jgi:hypothetical protein
MTSGVNVPNHKGVAAAFLVGLYLVPLCLGCSSTETTTRRTRPATSPDNQAASPRARVKLTGGAGLAGAATDLSVRCNFPDLEGLSIAVLANPPDPKSLARIHVAARKVTVVVSSGSGTEYSERAFEGTGVTSFEADKGAVLDSALTETAAREGSTRGTLGAVTAIKWAVECGDQTQGSSTVRITGATAEGARAGAALDPVRVECNDSPDGDEVIALGLMQVGATTALVKIGLTSDGTVTVDETFPSSSHRYLAGGSSTISTTGAHVRAEVVEQDVATPAPTLHVEGDLSCGLHAGG